VLHGDRAPLRGLHDDTTEPPIVPHRIVTHGKIPPNRRGVSAGPDQDPAQ